MSQPPRMKGDALVFATNRLRFRDAGQDAICEKCPNQQRHLLFPGQGIQYNHQSLIRHSRSAKYLIDFVG
jgi:hypothetical protein